MKIVPCYSLICPLDHQKLIKDRVDYRCANHHCFDISKGGYVNLLPVQFKRSKSPGDNIGMVNARRRTLEADIFRPLIKSVTEIISSLAISSKVDSMSILDAGCGTGHYIDQIGKTLQNLDLPKSVSLAGIDISKPAIQLACKLSGEITWCVASNKSVPLEMSSMNIICNFFGFPIWGEFLRILAKDGVVITVESGPDHLIEIRKAIYSNIRNSRKTGGISRDFSIYSNEQHTFRQPIGPEKILDLVSMTPHFYRAHQDSLKKLIRNPPSSITFDFFISKIIKN